MATKGLKLKVLPFDPYGDRLDLGKRWEKWVERFERDLKYNGCDPSEQPEVARMALLIYAGTEVEDLHDTLPVPVKPEGITTAQWTVYEKSKLKLKLYFLPKQCNDFTLFELMRMKPALSESITDYAMRLRKAADKCDFTNWSAEKMIKSLVISNMHDNDLRLKLLQKERTLDQILDIARKKEDAVARSKVMDDESGDSEVRKVRMNQSSRLSRKPVPTGQQKCNKCGHEKHFPSSECPAISRTCNFCKKKGHYASMCFKKQNIKAVDDYEVETTETDTDSEGDLKKIDILTLGNKVSLMKIQTNDQEVIWQPDTGTQRNVWDESHFRRFQKQCKRVIPLKTTSIKLFAYGSKIPLSVVGCFDAMLKAGDHEIKTEIYVTQESSTYPLLSESSAKSLGLIKYNESFLVKHLINDQKSLSDPCRAMLHGVKRQEIADLIVSNSELFSGKIGKSTASEVTLMIDPSVQPVVQKQRRIPLNLSEKVENKIKDLLSQDIIERVPDDEPRTWVSPAVIAPKPGSDDIRFCIDMRMANKAIKRPYTQIPTMEDIVHKFQSAERFTKLDIKESYHEFVLSDLSRNITTFYGPDRLYRYKRLNYGTKSAQDILQIEMQKMLSGIRHQVNIAYDILIGGTVEEHDEALEQVLSILKSKGITLNPKKCIFDAEEARFVGLVFTKDGTKPDAKNVKNLQEATRPSNKAELRSFLGMAGYSERFIPNFASIAHPLRKLLKEKTWH